jgi:threonine/homoserine/homoserine lactone efflux protein
MFLDLTFGGMGADRFALYLLVEGAMAVSPGAAVLFVINRGLAQGFSASLAATAGVLSANALYFIASVLGLSAIITAYPGAFRAVQWLGAAYLVFLAWGAWTARPGGLSLSQGDTRSHVQAYLSVFAAQMANPKALITFAAIVPPFINPAFPVAPQMAWLAAGSMVPELCVLAVYGATAAAARQLLNHPARLRLIEKCCAGLLLVIAALVVFA